MTTTSLTCRRTSASRTVVCSGAAAGSPSRCSRIPILAMTVAPPPVSLMRNTPRTRACWAPRRTAMRSAPAAPASGTAACPRWPASARPRRTAPRTAGRPARCPWGGPAEQGHRDRVEADRTGDVAGDRVVVPQDLLDRGETGQGAGHEHRERVDLRDVHAGRADASGLAPTARISKPSVPRSSSHQTPKAPWSATMTPVCVPATDGNSAESLAGATAGCRSRPLERVLGQQVQQRRGRHVVEHDRGDHLVGAGLRLEQARDGAPQRAAGHARDQRQQEVDARREVELDVAGADRADDQLSLGADVEQPGTERQADAETGADQRCGSRSSVWLIARPEPTARVRSAQ